jgi:hypothetical protein
VIVDEDRVRTALVPACADAGLDPAAFIVWIVNGRCPSGATPVAYLHPAASVRDDTVLVFRTVGEERAASYRGRAHRLALWNELPGFPEVALGPMLRHELEHARRWQRSGTRFYTADEYLRAAAGAAGYSRLPTEVEANAAAGDYARRVLSAAEFAELHAVPELGELLAAQAPADVVASTLVLLGAVVPTEEESLIGEPPGLTIELVAA